MPSLAWKPAVAKPGLMHKTNRRGRNRWKVKIKNGVLLRKQVIPLLGHLVTTGFRKDTALALGAFAERELDRYDNSAESEHSAMKRMWSHDACDPLVVGVWTAWIGSVCWVRLAHAFYRHASFTISPGHLPLTSSLADSHSSKSWIGENGLGLRIPWTNDAWRKWSERKRCHAFPSARVLVEVLGERTCPPTALGYCFYLLIWESGLIGIDSHVSAAAKTNTHTHTEWFSMTFHGYLHKVNLYLLNM